MIEGTLQDGNISASLATLPLKKINYFMKNKYFNKPFGTDNNPKKGEEVNT